ncbi:MAG: hypothetical protein EXS00_07755 [Phycisphaerales bacterium]|nr:hypothetical protein [Phycisphaerales bacterium]
MPPLGSRADVLQSLAGLNIASDGTSEGLLHGPGIMLEMMPQEDPVRQILLSINDEDIAWSVIMRMLGKLPWELLDPESGRKLKRDL